MSNTGTTSSDLVLGVQSGQTRLALDTLAALEHERAGDYQAAMRRLGFTEANWQLAVSPQGTSLILHLEGSDLDGSLDRLGSATEGFEGWLLRQLSLIVGQELDPQRLHQRAQRPMASFRALEHDEQDPN